MSLSRTEKMANAMQFLDANILIRHVTNDDPVKSPACFALIEAIERGEVSVWISDLIIAEEVFVLSSKKLYNLDRETIRDLLLPIINLPGIQIAWVAFGRVWCSSLGVVGDGHRWFLR